MKLFLSVLLASALGASLGWVPLSAQKPVEAAAPVFQDEAFNGLEGELYVAKAEWNALVDEATTTERKALRNSRPERTFYPRFRAAGLAGSGQSLLWALRNVKRAGLKGDVRKAQSTEHATLLLEKHVNEPWLTDEGAFKYLVRQGRTIGEDVVERLFRKAGATATKIETRALLLITLASRLELSRDEATRARGIALRDSVTSDFPMEALQASFSGQLFADMFLNVGQLAPDFSAKTVNGLDFKLSDVRGKITLVDFWGFW